MQWRRKRTKVPADLNIRIILLTTEVSLPHLIFPKALPSTPNSLDFNFNQGGWYVGDDLRLHLTNSGPLLILYQSIRAWVVAKGRLGWEETGWRTRGHKAPQPQGHSARGLVCPVGWRDRRHFGPHLTEGGDGFEGPEPGAGIGAEASEPVGAGLLLDSPDPQVPPFQFLLGLLLQNSSVAGCKLKTLVPSVGESHKHPGSNSLWGKTDNT